MRVHQKVRREGTVLANTQASGRLEPSADRAVPRTDRTGAELLVLCKARLNKGLAKPCSSSFCQPCLFNVLHANFLRESGYILHWTPSHSPVPLGQHQRSAETMWWSQGTKYVNLHKDRFAALWLWMEPTPKADV